MSGSQKSIKNNNCVAALAATSVPPPGGDYVWDGADEAERPLTRAEMEQAMRQRTGRPSGSKKQQVAIRLDHEILDAFKGTGKGWQTRINAALHDWLQTHSPA